MLRDPWRATSSPLRLRPQSPIDYDGDRVDACLEVYIHGRSSLMNAIIQPSHNDSQIACFFDALSKIDRGAAFKRLTYVVVKNKKTWYLLRARLDFNPPPRPMEPLAIQSDLVRAGSLDLASRGLTPKRFLTQLLSGEVKLPGVTAEFPKGSGSHHMLFYMPDINANSLNQRVENRLQIGGQSEGFFDHSAVRRDLKGNEDFCGDLHQLLTLYDLRPDWSGSGVWFVDLPKVELIVFEIEGGHSSMRLQLRPGYDQSLVSISVALKDAKDAGLPQSILRPDITWSKNADGQFGMATFILPAQADAEIIVKYDGKVQHEIHPTRIDSSFANGTLPFYTPAGIQSLVALNDLSTALGFGSAVTEGDRKQSKAKLPRPKRPLQRVVNKLYALSQSRCAYRGCEHRFFEGNHSRANVCHIKGAKPGTARYDETQSEEERRDFTNLILLCPNHHSDIDNDRVKYTFEFLVAMKAEHESNSTGD